MKAVISTTHDDKYLFFVPIVSWCWNKLGIGTIGFSQIIPGNKKWDLIAKILANIGDNQWQYGFDCSQHKAATYAQCARLYAACLDLPEDEVLITSDVDMAVFKIPPNAGGHIAICGLDLVPPNQAPICYISASASEWRRIFKLTGKTYQQCLDELLGDIECEHFRGNFWSKDQEEAYNKILGGNGHAVLLPRARPETQFADNRVDRDDSYWRDRLSKNLIDAHLWRPGYEENNFNNILELLQYMYPEENFGWLIEYRQKYIELL